MDFYTRKFITMVICMCICACVNIEDIDDRALLVQKLYNWAKPFGLGVFHDALTGSLSYEEAKELVGEYIDYCHGRLMKITVPGKWQGHEMDTHMYNLNNGENAAEQLVEAFRKEHCNK